MSLYTKIDDLNKVFALEGIKLKSDREFHVSLFFRSKDHDREHLLSKGKLILFTRFGIVNTGNLDNVHSDEFEEVTYDDFVNVISI